MHSEDRRLVAFVVLTFAWTWLLWAPQVLEARGVAGVPQPPNVGAFGPSVAAVVLVYRSRGPAGVVDLARRAVDVDFPHRWLLPTLLLFPAIHAGCLLVGGLLGEPVPPLPWSGEPLSVPVAFVVVLLSTGPLQEEFGWRGYALDRLQHRRSAVVASLALGAIWAAWHLPLFAFGEAAIYRPENAVGFVPSVLAVSVVLTWLYNNTGGSLLVAILAHASFNFSHWALPILEAGTARAIYPWVLFGVTGGIVLRWGPTDLARDRPRREETP